MVLPLAGSDDACLLLGRKMIWGLVQGASQFHQHWQDSLVGRLGFRLNSINNTNSSKPADPNHFSRGYGDTLIFGILYIDDVFAVENVSIMYVITENRDPNGSIKNLSKEENVFLNQLVSNPRRHKLFERAVASCGDLTFYFG